jgi:hypothetical protein
VLAGTAEDRFEIFNERMAAVNNERSNGYKAFTAAAQDEDTVEISQNNS